MAKKKHKTHKATAKRFKIKGDKVVHLAQGGGSGHSRGYMNRRQRKAKKNTNELSSTKESNKIRRLVGK